MIEELGPQLYKIDVPLPNNPLKATNAYVIKTPQRHLIIDTGMNRQECKQTMDDALEKLAIDLERTDLFITHLHADHLGLAGYLSSATSRVYFNRPDALIADNTALWDELHHRARKFGFPEAELEKAIRNHPGKRFSPVEKIPFHFLDDGDRLKIGEYQLECVHTPGHTQGHTCLYDSDKKLLISGDHILGDITPNISTWSETDNPLKKYFESLDRISRMDVKLVLPGHRSPIKDCQGRIQELIEHHRHRLEEIHSILKNGQKTAFQVASEMTWDIVSESWEAFPVNQKWFATGEAIAHLIYLEQEGLVKKYLFDGKTIYWEGIC